MKMCSSCHVGQFPCVVRVPNLNMCILCCIVEVGPERAKTVNRVRCHSPVAFSILVLVLTRVRSMAEWVVLRAGCDDMGSLGSVVKIVVSIQCMLCVTILNRLAVFSWIRVRSLSAHLMFEFHHVLSVGRLCDAPLPVSVGGRFPLAHGVLFLHFVKCLSEGVRCSWLGRLIWLASGVFFVCGCFGLTRSGGVLVCSVRGSGG